MWATGTQNQALSPVTTTSTAICTHLPAVDTCCMAAHEKALNCTRERLSVRQEVSYTAPEVALHGT